MHATHAARSSTGRMEPGPLHITAPVLPSTDVLTVPTHAKSAEPSGFSKVLDVVFAETTKGEKIVESASTAGSRDVSAAELLTLQAGVYRYVEVIDLASKLVDRVGQAAKTLTQGNG